jgi:uncharacterized membrane protein YbhN (UPF0104 family)
VFQKLIVGVGWRGGRVEWRGRNHFKQTATVWVYESARVISILLFKWCIDATLCFFFFFRVGEGEDFCNVNTATGPAAVLAADLGLQSL